MQALEIEDGTSKSDLAKIYKVNRNTIYTWINAGVDVYNPKAVDAHIESLAHKPPVYRENSAGMDYNEARTQKIILETLRLQRELDREDDRWTLNEVFRDDLVNIVTKLNAGLHKLAVEVAPMLLGLDSEAEIQAVLREYLNQRLLDFTKEELFSKYYLEYECP